MTLTHVMELSDPTRFAELLDYVGVAKKLIPEIEKKARETLDNDPHSILVIRLPREESAGRSQIAKRHSTD